MKRRRLCSGAFFLFLLLYVDIAVAQPTLAGPNPPAAGAAACPVPGPRMQFVGRATTICVPVTQNIWTTLSMPPGVEVYLSEDPHFERDYKREARQLHIMAKQGTPAGATDSIKILGPDYSATVLVLAAASTRPEIAIEYITEDEQNRRDDEARRFQEEQAKRQELEQRIVAIQSTIASLRSKNAETARALAATKAELTAMETTHASTQAQLAATRVRNEELEGKVAELERSLADLARQLAESQRQLAESQRQLAESQRHLAESRKAAVDNRRAWLIDAYKRQQEEPTALQPVITDWIPLSSAGSATLRVRYQEATWLGEAMVLPIDISTDGDRPVSISPPRVLDNKGGLLLSYVLEPSGPENDAKGILTTVREGRSTRVVLAVDVPPDACTECLHIELREYGSLKAPLIAQIPRFRLIPVTQEQEKRERWGKQVILGPSGGVASCWLAESAGSTSLDSMACYSLGVRLTKGFTETFAFEAEALGGWTASGEMRSAKFGRATLAGVLRFGAYTSPYVRVGIGGQAGSVDGSSEVGAFWTAGAGVTRRLSENAVVGIGLSWEESASDDSAFRRSVGIGLQLGVGWNP